MRKFRVVVEHTGFTVPDPFNRVRVSFTEQSNVIFEAPDAAGFKRDGTPNAALARRVEAVTWYPCSTTVDEVDPDTEPLCDDYVWLTGTRIVDIKEVVV